MNDIIDTIGLPAMLEQLAEECSELAQASLKYARLLRGENPTPKTRRLHGLKANRRVKRRDKRRVR